MTTERDAFLAAICAQPDDDTVRLVYADWLEDHGEPDRAAFIRVQVEDATACHECDELGSCPPSCRRCHLQRWERELWHRLPTASVMVPAGEYQIPSCIVDRGSGFKLVATVPHQPRLSFSTSGDLPQIEAEFHRGFIAHVTLTAADFMAHAADLYWHPGQTVGCPTCATRVDIRNHEMRRYGGWLCRECGTGHPPGRVPRPFVPTAHPIERVTLTALMPSPRIATAAALVYRSIWDLCKKHGRLTDPLWLDLGRWGFWLDVLGAEWPHVKFTPGPGVRNPYAGFEAGVG